ncbi:hypothetical protein HPHPP3_1296 [Helicobacter pylori Hp P-3]|nr:hypothetical protein HPHPP3_1296 [Helicobacter pylori Hp P-3]EJC56400.1 hypothetical protein HPHPP3B_1201 [Helicobacter pylori Hp P-3b]
MGILYHELVAFIPNAKDIWDFCFGWLKKVKSVFYHQNTKSLTQVGR